MNHFPFTVRVLFSFSLHFARKKRKRLRWRERKKGNETGWRLASEHFFLLVIRKYCRVFCEREMKRVAKESKKKKLASSLFVYVHRFHIPKRWLARVNTITHHRRAIVCSTQTCYCPHFNIFTINFLWNEHHFCVCCCCCWFFCAAVVAAAVIVVVVIVFSFFSYPLLISIISSTLL